MLPTEIDTHETGDSLRPATAGYPPAYALAGLLLIIALVGIVVMVVADAERGFAPSLAHQHAAAMPLIAIGLANIALQSAHKAKAKARVLGALLGMAFLLWGGEDLMPAGSVTTIMDEGAVAIFVIDIGLVLWARLTGRGVEADG